MSRFAKTSHALVTICCLAVSMLAPAAAFAAAKNKVLFVASNMLDMGDPEQHDARNNLWEYAPPFHVFVMHGYEVEFVSPQGGEIEFMMDPLGISSYAIKYENFLGKAANTLKPGQVDAAQYQAVYIGGGYGALFDVASNEELMSLIGRIYEKVASWAAAGMVPVASPMPSSRAVPIW